MRRFGLPILLLFLLGGFGAWWALQPPIKPGVTLDNFRWLHKYMTRAQVESILGKGRLDGEIMRWKSGNAEIAIAFFDRGEAASGSFYVDGKDVANLRESAGTLEKFRLWLYQRTGW